MNKLLLLVAVLLPLLVSGCAQRQYSDPGYSRGGPPPHAPAHGYRHKGQSHDLVFDSGLGVYVVQGRPDYYFWDNRYFRYHDGDWQYAADLDGRWYRDDGYVPRKLYQSKGGSGKAHHGKGAGKDKGKGNRGNGNSDRY